MRPCPPTEEPSRPSLHPAPALGSACVISLWRDPPLAGGQRSGISCQMPSRPAQHHRTLEPRRHLGSANTRSSPEQGGQESRDQVKDPLGSHGHWALGGKAEPWRPARAKGPPGPGPRHTEPPISTLGKSNDGPTSQTEATAQGHTAKSYTVRIGPQAVLKA